MFGTNKKRLDQLFIDLCEAHHKNIVKYLYYAIGNTEEAHDLAQEVFTIVYKQIELLETHENAAGFIYQTAKFVVANYKRKVAKKIQNEQVLVEDICLEQEEDAYSTLLHMEDQKIYEEDYIEQVISCISEEKQQLYRMHYVEGKNYRQIAEALGVSEVGIRMKYVRLRREIKQIVSQLAEEKFI